MFKSRMTLGYLVLVGVPLLFLFGTLRAGRSLTAPAAVSGDWTVQGSKPLPPGMNIYQTGPELLVTFRDPQKTQIHATLENGHIAGMSGRTHLEATLSGPAGKRVMEGQISVDGSPVPFRATKSATQEK